MLALAKGDIPRQQLENHQSEKVKALMQGRIAIESWPRHVDKIKGFVAQAKAMNGKMPIALRYWGGHTGRWSGMDGNMQNLGSRGHELVSEVRTMFVAPPGHKLVIVDLNAVEARGTAWIAGETDLVECFSRNEDPYCQFASTFYGCPVRKPRKDGIPAIEQKMKDRRAFGKVVILGAGYGMGAGRFEEYASCDQETAEQAITTYRTKYPMIPAFWKSVEQAFIYTARYGAPCELPRGLRFEHLDDCDVQIILPSGHTLQYHQVKLVAGKYSDTAEVYNALTHSWNPIWGGVLTENCVQSFCRHLLVESMLRLEDRGVHTALSVHDELVAVVPDEKADQALALMISEMSKTPDWAPGLPLDASGHISSRYGKD
jgi:DNA polymerase